RSAPRRPDACGRCGRAPPSRRRNHSSLTSRCRPAKIRDIRTMEKFSISCKCAGAPTRGRMVSAELWRLSAAEAHQHFRDGSLLPSEVLGAVLGRLDAVNDRINAFAAIDREGARASAAASDARWKAGRSLGPLDGSVLTVKDNITVKGLPCAWGS